MRTKWFLILPWVLVLPRLVSAHTESEPQGFGWAAYLITLGIVIVVVTAGLALLRRLESQPGSLPIRKLSIAAAVTIGVNAVIFAIIYLEV